MNISTLEKLYKLQAINEACNNPRGNYLNKTGKEIAGLIETNLELAIKKLGGEVSIREQALALRSDKSDEQQERLLLDEKENETDNYQRVILANHSGEVIELCNLNFSRSWRKEKYEKDKVEGIPFTL